LAPVDMDRFDLAILKLFQQDARLVADAIGDEVGLSAASVQRRLKRLRETGVIKREEAVLNQAALGYPVTCVVGVDVDYDGAVQIDRFKKRMLAHPQVQQCYYVTGQLDFMLVVVAQDMADYEAFTRATLLNDANVRSFTTYVVMDAVKSVRAIPIPGSAK
jgi:DNA-binding Lrp family transcriptional regulator